MFYIANRGDLPVTVQIQAMDWTETGNTEKLVPSDTFFASPPLVHVAPGQRQTVRLLAEPADPEREHQYRLIASQLPQGVGSQNVVRFLLQFNVPVFVSQPPAAKPDVVWSLGKSQTGWLLAMRNRGGATIKVLNLRLSTAPGESQFSDNRLSYVLPGGTRTWPVTLSADVTHTVHVTATDARSGASLDADVTPRD